MTNSVITRAVIIAILLGACAEGTSDVRGPLGDRAADDPVPRATTESPPAEPSVPETPSPTRGQATPRCVEGWRTPGQGTRLYGKPLRLIRRIMDVRGPFEVVDMRYFEGPEAPPSDKGYIQVVERWYVKGFLRKDPAIQGRWLVEAREFGSGVVAVAPYDTQGFRSPDWVGFQHEAARPRRERYEGLPGGWAGEPYNFVRGGKGLDIPGLPDEVIGCMGGT